MNVPEGGAQSFIPRRLVIPVFLALVAAGLAGNYLRYEIFFNIQFIFGSIFVMLALQFLGLGPGVLAAVLIGSITWQLWNHPYFIVIAACEALVVGWLNRRRGVTFVQADALYWLCLGIPLVFLFYYGVMHLALATASVTAVKQSINGIANALVARLIFTALLSRSRTALFSLREVVLNLLALFVLAPSLTILAIESRTDLRETEQGIREDLIATGSRATQVLDTWVEGHLSLVDQLADMAAWSPPADVQRSLDRVLVNDTAFLRLGLADASATMVAFAPRLDDGGRPGIGKNYADRPFVPLLKSALRPMLSEVVMARFGPAMPSVTLLAPVIVNGGFGGYVAGVLDLKGINSMVAASSSNIGMLYTLLDRNGRVIVTNRPGLKGMDTFQREAGEIFQLPGGVAQWISSRHKNVSISDRWNNSFYVKESPIGKISEWHLILEQPIAPFQKMLYAQYTVLASWLLALLLAALLVGEYASRKIVAPLEELEAVSTGLPDKLQAGVVVTWGGSFLAEPANLFVNFKETAAALSRKFNEVIAMNTSLEATVAERTQSLRESEERYRRLAENAQDLIFRYELTPMRGFSYVNPAATAVTGFTPEEHYADPDLGFNLVHPDDVPLLEAQMRDPTPFGAPLTLRWLRKDGRQIWTEQRNVPIRDAAGTIVAIEGVARDITERKHLEQEREQYFTLFETSTDLMVIADPNGAFLKTNPACTEVLGYSGAELLAQPFVDFVHPEDRQPTLDEMARQQQVGNSFNFENRYRCKDGSYRVLSWKAVFVKSEGITYATARDITERKQAEVQIRGALHEKEVLLKEVHHRVKNNMQVICSLLNLQARGIADGAVRALFEESRDRVNSMALIHERLYRSEDLAHIDFKAYLLSLVQGIASTYKRPEIVVSVEMESLSLDVNAGIPCGLIVNELVSNCFKHAFPGGRSGAIRVGISRNAAGGCELTVADDGVGFPPGLDYRTTSSLGLQLVIGLVGQIRGTIELARGDGTRFVIAFPGPPSTEEGRNG